MWCPPGEWKDTFHTMLSVYLNESMNKLMKMSVSFTVMWVLKAASHRHPEKLLNILTTMILLIWFLLAKRENSLQHLLFILFFFIGDESIDHQRSVKLPQGFPAVGLTTLCSDFLFFDVCVDFLFLLSKSKPAWQNIFIVQLKSLAKCIVINC